MTIRTGVIIVGSVFLYFLIGAAQAIITALRAGRGNAGLLSDFGGLTLTLLWPFMDLIAFVFWVIGKYTDFLDWIKKRGELSMMPPENEAPGRRV